MDTKKFDVIGIGHPCVDYLAHIDSLPASNESRSVLNGSWQCGGKIPTGLAAAARCGLSCALIGAMGDDLFGQYCYKDFEDHGIDLHTPLSERMQLQILVWFFLMIKPMEETSSTEEVLISIFLKKKLISLFSVRQITVSSREWMISM